MPEKTIFRQKALMLYNRRMEKDVVARILSWPIILGLWLLLGALLATGFFVWYVQVPIYVEGSGIILAQGDMLQPAYENTVAIVFLPPDQAADIRPGQSVNIQIGSTGLNVQSTIAQVEPGITSPSAARSRFRLDGAGALLITQPSRVVIIKLGTELPATTYAGSLLTASVETGSQNLLTLLLGSGQLLGSSS
jgi:hypothetical protein